MEVSRSSSRLPLPHRTCRHVQRGWHSACGYLIDGIGITHQRNLNILQPMAGVFATLDGPWILGADFNCTAQQLKDTGWLKLVWGDFFATQGATCNGRTIDFFVVSANLVGHVEGIKIIEDALCHPHKPVRLYLKAQPRLMPVRTLKYPPNLGAVLPHGPANLAQPLPDGIDEMSKGERYRLSSSERRKRLQT